MEKFDYTPNSHKYKNEQKERQKPQKVISSEVKVQRKNGTNKFTDNLKDDFSKVWDYIVNDVIIPSTKKAVSDIIKNGIDMILYPGSGRPSNSNIPAAKVSYINYSNPSYPQQQRPVNRSAYSYGTIVYPNRGDAELVLSQMDAIMEEYDLVRVSDMFDLSGVTGSYTDNNYGWTDIRSAEIQRVRDGYVIKMPRALPID